MSTISKYIISSILFLSIVTSSKAQGWSAGGEIGFMYMSLFQNKINTESSYTSSTYPIQPFFNKGFFLNYYTPKSYYFSLNYTSFFYFSSDLFSIINPEVSRFYFDISSNEFISFRAGYDFKVGNEGFALTPIGGIGLELLRQQYDRVPDCDNINNYEPCLKFYNFEGGVNPSLQAGLQFSFRDHRSKFSIKTLFNFGLRYHTIHEYSVLSTGTQFTTRSKGDFMIAHASYEYIFRSKPLREKRQAAKKRR